MCIHCGRPIISKRLKWSGVKKRDGTRYKVPVCADCDNAKSQLTRFRKVNSIPWEDPRYSFFPFVEWGQKLESLDYRCQMCGKQGEVTIDHIIPMSKGGTNDIDNLQPLCKSCNSSKGNRPMKNIHAQELGRLGRSVNSESQKASSAENGKKGGRPTENLKVWAVWVKYECRLGVPGTLISRHTTHKAALAKARKTGYSQFLEIQNLTD